MTAYEDEKIVRQTKISSGFTKTIPEGQIPWNTPVGSWQITLKMLTLDMGIGNITSNLEAYELLGVT